MNFQSSVVEFVQYVHHCQWRWFRTCSVRPQST